MSTFIVLDGHRLMYTTAGCSDAPPLLMIHGWLSHRGVWRQTIPVLQDHYHCVAIDLLGFGDSDKPADADYSIEAQSRRVLQIADALGLDKFALIGHSMGGQIALCITSMLAPGRVTKLASVAGVVTGRLTPRVERVVYTQIAMGAACPRLYGLSRWMTRHRQLAYFTFRPWFYDMDSVPFDEWEIDRRMVFQPGIHISAHRAGQGIHGLNLTPHLARITAPALTIHGQQDGTVPISDARQAAQYIPNHRLSLIDQCGHFPMYERTQTYLDALCGFLV
jgi:pimeloyl-ACP methyl ester carboxylesterase